MLRWKRDYPSGPTYATVGGYRLYVERNVLGGWYWYIPNCTGTKLCATRKQGKRAAEQKLKDLLLSGHLKTLEDFARCK